MDNISAFKSESMNYINMKTYIPGNPHLSCPRQCCFPVTMTNVSGKTFDK